MDVCVRVTVFNPYTMSVQSTKSSLSLEERFAHLEHRVTRLRRINTALVAAALLVGVSAWRPAAPPPVLRVRGLVVVDDKGRDRIVLGAPVPDVKEGKRSAPGTGLVVNDTAGYERFGLNLFPDGRLVMGLDAPPHTGDDRNRERISLVADKAGGAYIRFLDRKTQAKAFLSLDDDDQVYLDLLDWDASTIRSRRVGARGDTNTVEKR